MMKLATFRADDMARIDTEAMLEAKHRAWLKDRGWRCAAESLRAASPARRARRGGAAQRVVHGNYGFPMDPAEVDFAGRADEAGGARADGVHQLDGAPVGVGMFLPDFQVLFRRMNGRLFPLGWAKFLAGSRSLDAALVQFIATSPAQQGQGLIRIVVAELIRRLQRAGFRTLDSTWISESNAPSRAQARALGMRVKHELQLYGCSLQ
jgi:hypothetical protein